MREEEKAWWLEGFRLIHVAVWQSCMNAGIGSAHCTLRRERDALDSARSLGRLEKFSPPLSGETFLLTGEGGQRALLLATLQQRGLSQYRLHRSAR
jgi:hypothetical protein